MQHMFWQCNLCFQESARDNRNLRACLKKLRLSATQKRKHGEIMILDSSNPGRPKVLSIFRKIDKKQKGINLNFNYLTKNK
jgi:hypothetical protein